MYKGNIEDVFWKKEENISNISIRRTIHRERVSFILFIYIFSIFHRDLASSSKFIQKVFIVYLLHNKLHI